jgi:hypothetical protein
MANIQVASGQQIFDAAVEGAKRKFNRSTDDYSIYESMLNEFYEMMLSDNNNKAACDRVRNRTKNNWRNANFPITLIMYHKHRAMKSCETHARVCLTSFYNKIFDIPLEYWELFEEQNKEAA